MVANVSHAWHRTQGSDGRPLHVRHDELVDALAKIGSNGIFPVSENSVDAMAAELAQRKRPPAWDARFEGARIDFEDEISTYMQLLVKVAKEQVSLGYLATNPDHLILRDVAPHLLAVQEPAQAIVDRIFPKAPRTRASLPGEIAKPVLDVDGYREARIMMAREVTKLRDLLENMLAVFRFESAPTADKAKLLIAAQQHRINDLEARLRDLEHQQSTPATTTRKRANG